MLSKDVLQTVVQSAADAGVNLTNIVMMDKGNRYTGPEGRSVPAGLLWPNHLVKAVQEMGLSTPEGWFDMNYNFLGLDLTATPWEYVKNFTFTWGRDRRDPDPHSGRPFPVCVQQAHHEDPASGRTLPAVHP